MNNLSDELKALGKGIDSLIPNVTEWHTEKIVCPKCESVTEGEQYARAVKTSRVCENCVSEQETVQFRGKVKTEIPTKYRQCLVSDAPKLKDDTYSAILWGSYGVGKTHALWAMVKKYGKKDYIKTSEYRLSSDLKNGYADNTHEQRVKRYKETGLLCIDEFGKVKDTDNHRAMMFDILDYRYEYDKLTIIAVNCASHNDLLRVITPDVMDRFRCNVLSYTGESRR